MISLYGYFTAKMSLKESIIQKFYVTNNIDTD